MNAQWTSKIPQTKDTVWIYYNKVIDANTVWMGGPQYSFQDSVGGPGNFISMYSTSDGGANWKYKKFNLDTADAPFLSSITGIDGSNGWATVYLNNAGTNLVLKTIDGGLNWTTTAATTFLRPESFVNAISFKDAQNGIMMGDPSPLTDSTNDFFEIYRTTDGGTSWTRIAENKIPASLLGEYGTSGEFDRIGDKLWFVTSEGRLFYSTDGGQNWAVRVVGTGFASNLHFVDNMHGLCIAKDTNYSAIGSDIKYTEDGGTIWQHVKSPFVDSTYFWSVTLIPQSNYILTNHAASLQGAPYTTLITKDKGANWIVIGTSDGLANARFVSPSVGYGGEGVSMGQNHATKIFKYSGSPLSGLLTPTLLKADFAIYPNPTLNKMNVKIDLEKSSSLYMIINSPDGKLVWSKTILDTVKNFDEAIDLSFLATGTYILTISSPEGNLSKTFVKE